MLRGISLCVLVCTLLALAGAAPAQQIHLPPAVAQGQGMGDVTVTQGNEAQRQQALAANVSARLRSGGTARRWLSLLRN